MPPAANGIVWNVVLILVMNLYDWCSVLRGYIFVDECEEQLCEDNREKSWNYKNICGKNLHSILVTVG